VCACFFFFFVFFFYLLQQPIDQIGLGPGAVQALLLALAGRVVIMALLGAEGVDRGARGRGTDKEGLAKPASSTNLCTQLGHLHLAIVLSGC
jgi:hypothetical protein